MPHDGKVTWSGDCRLRSRGTEGMVGGRCSSEDL
jgi:hypothetical protein